ncbi:ataxin-2-like protein isoform X1 [Astyanax mexicanus]|uniref:ataxin-2-like protein isoform X1 n=1 Tax=Astyanax mexicanus TaxID=7994 RepID=UPI0020CAA816|nr:ataxin-2-like protein isoform X1 [Astyanax mexicanus]
MLKAQSGPGGPGGRRPANGAPGPSVPGSANRTPAGRNRTVKPPLHTSQQVFEGIYNNARMTHFLTAVVGSTCDVRVKNGTLYEGIFKTLSSRCELAVDAVHKRGEEDGSPALPRREEITDIMIFSPADVVTMTCRDVDLNYATKDTFTDVAISSTRVNGEHKEKVLQRWDAGDSNGESYDLETDASNGWDANEMFRFNEETYGVKSTYDSSLSMYTTPLERSGSEGYKQREARAARLANEIEASVQYRHRVALENDDGRSEEEKYSAVLRDGGERESPRERERGRDSPSNVNREGKYIPLPQRVRDMGGPGGGGRDRGGRVSGGFASSRPTPAGSGPRPAVPSPGPQSSPSERSSPMSNRTGFSPNTHTNAPSPRPSDSSTLGSPSSPTAPVTHPHPSVPHSHSLPHGLSDAAARPVNGVSSRTSPKAQRPLQTNRSARTSTTHLPTTASRSPKSDPAADSSSPGVSYVDAMPLSMAKQMSSGPAPLFPVDVNEILSAAGKDKPLESPLCIEEAKTKAPSAQQRSQIEELRKFGKEFRLQPSHTSSSSTSAGLTHPGSVKPASQSPSPAAEPKASLSPNITPSLSPNITQNLTPSPQPQPPALVSPAEDPSKEGAIPLVPPMGGLPISERQSAGTPQPARTPGAEVARTEAAVEGVTDQVKKSTLNPNAKEFNPNKPPLALSKPSTAPTPPRPNPPSQSVVLQHPPGQNTIYNAPYLSYVSQIHSVQAPQMYQYAMSAVNQGKYRPSKGSVVTHPPRSDHGSSAPPVLHAAPSAAGASLVPSPYPQSYLQYNPQQYSQQQVIQAMSPYGQPMYSVLQSGARMLGQSGGHPQTLGPPTGPQFPGQSEGPQGPQQGLYAAQSFAHHSGSVHPQPSSTPTGNQPPPQHTAPSPGQTPQSGPQSLYHSAPTPPNLPPGHSSPQASYSLQGYGLHGHQPLTHTYPTLGQLAQAHVPGPMSAPHHSGNHGPPQVVMLHAPPPQAGPGSAPQHPQHGPQQGPAQHFAYIGHPSAVQVQPHPSQQIPFHPPGN